MNFVKFLRKPFFLIEHLWWLLLDFEFFCRPSPQFATLDMILKECKQLRDFPVMTKSTLRKWCRKLGFCYRRRATLLTMRLRYSVFLRILSNIFSIQLYQKTRLLHRLFHVNFANFLNLKVF